jgi:uncharacterized membrane protein YfcA
MGFDPLLAFATFGIGIVVGLTGMGGGALMTPVLVLFFSVPPLTAVSSDLVASAIMKPVGSVVHLRRGTVHLGLVKWLCIGSIPGAFSGVLIARALGRGQEVQDVIRTALGVALLLAAIGLIVRAYIRLVERARQRDGRADPLPQGRPSVNLRPLPTVVLGALGGIVVGLTSVGSGSLIIIALMALYPTLKASELVGTDLVQAVPLVGSAALGHIFFGDFHLDRMHSRCVGRRPSVGAGSGRAGTAGTGLRTPGFGPQALQSSQRRDRGGPRSGIADRPSALDAGSAALWLSCLGSKKLKPTALALAPKEVSLHTGFRSRVYRLGTSSLLLAGLACGSGSSADKPTDAMTSVAESYVKLVLALGQHDPNYVDAYYGPKEWSEAAKSEKLPIDTIRARQQALETQLAAITLLADDTLAVLRHEYLSKQLRAMGGRLDFLSGVRRSFDEESAVLYDATAPTLGEGHFKEILARLERELPGKGPLPARFESYRARYTIPRERLDTVFRVAIAECRTRTARHLELPPGESFTVEYVKDKPWSGYNWYQGGYRSVIQVNTDLPIFIDRAIDLACHEGYPGHHVYNASLEQHLVRDRGWVEFTVYPLFSPQSLIAEGSANYGIEMAFPDTERVGFERERLFPLAGLDPAGVDRYYRIMGLQKQLAYAGNEAARRYLNGEIDSTAAANWLTRYALMEPARARQRVRFFDTYRSYVINYNLGEDLVRAYVERLGGNDQERRWKVFGALLASPRLPSGLH